MTPGRLAVLVLTLGSLGVVVGGVSSACRPGAGDRAAGDAAAPDPGAADPAGADGGRPGPAPRRIIPASAGLADLVCALVPPERIAALPSQVRDYSGLRDGGERYLERPEFDVFATESVLAFGPDLVITDPWQNVATSDRLREAGVPVLVAGPTETLADVRAALRGLAEALGADEAGARVQADLDGRLAALAAGAPRRAGLRALAYSNGGTGGWAVGAGTAGDEWIRLAGCVNAAAAAGRAGHGRCSFEELLALDPDVLVVPGTLADGELSATARLLRDEPALRTLRALGAGAVVILPPWLFDTVSQHIVTAAETLAAAIDAFPAPADAPPPAHDAPPAAPR